jgi:hypothetical protein
MIRWSALCGGTFEMENSTDTTEISLTDSLKNNMMKTNNTKPWNSQKLISISKKKKTLSCIYIVFSLHFQVCEP